MGRKKKTYTLVTIDDGKIVTNGYETIEAVCDALASTPDPDAVLFVGEPLAFTINHKPTVTIGAPRVRAKRAVKAKKPAAAKE